MQVRLKYAGIDAAIISNIEQAIGAVADEEAGDTFYAVANYTAFPPLVKELDELKGADRRRSVTSHAVTRANGSAVPTDIAPVELSRPLRIVYLYPDALNLYGDGGNVIALERRCAWRGIPARVDEVRMGEIARSHRRRHRHDGRWLRPRPAGRGTRAVRSKRQGRGLC